MKKLITLFFAVALCCAATTVSAQSIDITGTVTEKEGGDVMPGVRVAVELAGHGLTGFSTVTGPDGKYTMGIPPGKTFIFIFSAPGYKTERVLVESANICDVQMEADGSVVGGESAPGILF